VAFFGALPAETLTLAAGHPVSANSSSGEAVTKRVERLNRELVRRFTINLPIVRVGRRSGLEVVIRIRPWDLSNTVLKPMC
jgi:hypothetical protein